MGSGGIGGGVNNNAPGGFNRLPLPGSTLYSAQAPSQDFYSTSSAPSPSHAITIPPSNALPISIPTTGPPSSVRLSTTPLFPSPLAQASGPEEDPEQTKGEDGDEESEDDGMGRPWGKGRPGREGSPLVRENLAPFGGELTLHLSFEAQWGRGGRVGLRPPR